MRNGLLWFFVSLLALVLVFWGFVLGGLIGHMILPYKSVYFGWMLSHTVHKGTTL